MDDNWDLHLGIAPWIIIMVLLVILVLQDVLNGGPEHDAYPQDQHQESLEEADEFAMDMDVGMTENVISEIQEVDLSVQETDPDASSDSELSDPGSLRSDGGPDRSSCVWPYNVGDTVSLEYDWHFSIDSGNGCSPAHSLRSHSPEPNLGFSYHSGWYSGDVDLDFVFDDVNVRNDKQGSSSRGSSSSLSQQASIGNIAEPRVSDTSCTCCSGSDSICCIEPSRCPDTPQISEPSCVQHLESDPFLKSSSTGDCHAYLSPEGQDLDGLTKAGVHGTSPAGTVPMQVNPVDKPPGECRPASFAPRHQNIPLYLMDSSWSIYCPAPHPTSGSASEDRVHGIEPQVHPRGIHDPNDNEEEMLSSPRITLSFKGTEAQGERDDGAMREVEGDHGTEGVVEGDHGAKGNVEGNAVTDVEVGDGAVGGIPAAYIWGMMYPEGGIE